MSLLFITFYKLVIITQCILCEKYKISLLYPVTDIIEVNFMNYSWAFETAISHVNNHSIVNGNNITFVYTIDDTNTNTERVGDFEKKSLRIISKRSSEGYDAFIGPGLKLCAYQARLVAAFNKPMVGYKCNEGEVSNKVKFPTFARTAPPDSFLRFAVLPILSKYNWSRLAVISGGEDDGESRTLNARNMLVHHLKSKVSFKSNFNEDTDYGTFFTRLKKEARVIFFITDQDSQYSLALFILNACVYNMTNGEYVFYFADVNNILSLKRNDFHSNDLHWGENLNEILTYFRGEPHMERIKIRCALKTLKRSFLLSTWIEEDTMASSRLRDLLNCTKDIDQIDHCQYETPNPNAVYLYNAVQLYYQGLLNTKLKSQDTRDGTVVMGNAKNMSFRSITGFDISTDGDLDTKFNLTVFSIQSLYRYFSPDDKRIIGNKTYIHEWLPIGSFVMEERADGKKFVHYHVSKKIDGWKDFPPPDHPKCGFKGELCIDKSQRPKGNTSKTVIAIVTIIGVLLVCGLYVGLYLYRKKVALESMNWKIDSSEICLDVKKVYEGSKASLFSEAHDVTKKQIFSKVGTYKSQLVTIKELKDVKVVLNRPALIELRNMLDLCHENVNPFLGMVIRCNKNLLIYQYCPKGSLQDVLANDDIKLDTMFMMSFARDIVKGLDYIHHSVLSSHGRLKSTNCIIDSRWLVKITDYGTSFLRDGLNPLHECDENAFYTSLLWTAPELLRMSNPPSNGTKKGDIYSFGIVLQEIITRLEPFSMYELDAADIIKKVKQRADPPFRPAVQKYRTHLNTIEEKQDDQELYNLMKMCYAEEPDARPSFLDIKKFLKKITHKNSNVFEHMVKMLEKYSSNLENVVEERTKLLIEEKTKTDDLIYRMLPSFVAEQLKHNERVEAERYDEVTIYFSDIVGFTTIAGLSNPIQVVDLLNDLYTLFDTIIKSHDVYKVETIGDAYMVVSGVPIRNGHMHAVEIAEMSLHILRAVDEQFIIRHMPETKLQIRIGLHSGPVAAGVVGRTMPRYCLFGDTVNRASRMESNGEALKIHISRETKELLDQRGVYKIVARDGAVELKNVGLVQTYWLLGRQSIKVVYKKKTAKVSPMAALVDSISNISVKNELVPLT